MFKKLKSWWKHKQVRKVAEKHGLDFKHTCVFDHQLRNYGYPKNGKIIDVEMRSGRIGLYKSIITRHWEGGTGQKDWKFEFQGYKE
jgi:hypothetical protein